MRDMAIKAADTHGLRTQTIAWALFDLSRQRSASQRQKWAARQEKIGASTAGLSGAHGTPDGENKLPRALASASLPEANGGRI